MARFERSLLTGAELALAALPRRAPAPAHWRSAKIVAHRGDTGGGRVPENTVAAFDPLLDGGVWGMEFDVRWTADLEPVLSHDPDLRRVFGLPLRIAELRFAELRHRCPRIPHLDEVVARYGGRLHLMLELKTEPYPDPERQRRRLAECLAGLAPSTDYHVLALDTALFRHVPDIPRDSWLPVAKTNVRAISDFALHNDCGGFAGPAPLLRWRHLLRHRQANQSIGVGLPFTRGLLERELLRGVDWLFTNHALRLARWREKACQG